MSKTKQPKRTIAGRIEPEIAAMIIGSWLAERERNRIGVALYGAKGLPTVFDCLPEGWHLAYIETRWKRAGN
jgi:hypothetical protein